MSGHLFVFINRRSALNSPGSAFRLPAVPILGQRVSPPRPTGQLSAGGTANGTGAPCPAHLTLLAPCLALAAGKDDERPERSRTARHGRGGILDCVNEQLDTLRTTADAGRTLPSYGPAWDAAIEFGIDVTLLEHNLALSPSQRLQQLDEMLRLYFGVASIAR
jgi:hypothetical protein